MDRLALTTPLLLALSLTTPACAGAATATATASAPPVERRLRSMEPRSIEHACLRYIGLARQQVRLSPRAEVDYAITCVGVLDEARQTASSEELGALLECANRAASIERFQACVDPDSDALVIAPVPVPIRNLAATIDMSEDQKTERARLFYLQAEELAREGEWILAVIAYEQAYYLVPGKHGFAHKVGYAAFAAGDCDKANAYLKHFLLYADPDEHESRIVEAKQILAEISISGCARH